MLSIRPEQMKEFDDVARNDFHRRLAEFLRDELPEETAEMNDRQLREYIVECEERAALYGVETEAGIARWSCLSFGAGMDFDKIPQVQEYLTHADEILGPDERVELLVERLEEEG